jgi:hypothetical protein
MKTRTIFHAALLAAIFLGGCLAPTHPPNQDEAAFRTFTPQELTVADFAREIEKLLVITRDPTTGAMTKSEAHRRLAILHLNPRNPARDLPKAITELGKFLESAPENLNRPSAASWATALKSAIEFQGMEKKIAGLENQVAGLNNRNRQQTKEKEEVEKTNRELKKTLEQLKELDLSLEKKRKNFR